MNIPQILKLLFVVLIVGSFSAQAAVSPISEAAVTPNQQATASYIVLTGGTPAVQALIASLSTDPQFQGAMDQISGATYATEALMVARIGNWFSSALSDRTQMFPSCEGTLKYDVCTHCCLPCDALNQFWVAGHGAQESIAGGEVSGLNSKAGNVAGGYERVLNPCARIGIAVSYTVFSGDEKGNEMGTLSGNLYQIGLYGYRRMGDWLLGAEIDGGATTHLETDRHIQSATGIADTRGNSKAQLYTEQVVLSYDMLPRSVLRFSPFAGLIAQQLKRNKLTENTVTGFELNVGTSNYSSVRSELGGLLEVPTGSALKPFVSANWQHEFSNQNASFDASLVGVGGSFHIEGASVARDSVLVKAGTMLWSGKNWNVAVLYQGWYGGSWQENGGTLEINFVL
jgi:subtilase-type serine protease